MMLKTAQNLAKLRRTPPPVGQTPHSVVHQENKWRLLRFEPKVQRYRTPILMIPSMINRWYVLDLMPGRSLTEWLTQQGHEVYIVDWGKPTDEDRHLRFDDVVGRYLRRALRRSAKASQVEKVHVLGYCMGGTLAAIHAAVYPERFASLTALAAPVAFDDDGLLGVWTRSNALDIDAFLRAFGNAPWPILQASFQLLKPTLNLSKWVFLVDRAVLDRAWDDPFLNGFFAKERWANDNVSLPGELFRTWVQDIYQGDALRAGALRLDGRAVDLAQICAPLHAITFEDDYIVPKSTAQPLLELTSSKDTTATHLRGGHVGAVVSQSASKRLWPILQQWWADRDGARALTLSAS
ncbi:MAG: alpha/beta fold hydrolase [Myxococcota bacterium]